MKHFSIGHSNNYTVILFVISAIVGMVSTYCNKASVDESIMQSASALQRDNAVAVLDSSLQVKGAFLTFKRNGDTIILYGVNVPVFGSGWSNDVAVVAAAVKANTLANSVRINWYSKTVKKQCKCYITA